MQFSVLGVLDVDDGQHVDLGGMTRRALLGYLLLHDNRIVPTSRIRTALWGDAAPPTAHKIVHNAVSALRKTFARGAMSPALLTEPTGYRLRVDPESIDLCRFRHLAELGRTAVAAGALDSGRRQLRAAVDLWSGNALADLVEHGFEWSELVALEDERWTAHEDCLDAELACGRHREITPELQVLTTTTPLREAFHRQYMLALYRSGRQAEALDAYQRSRAVLVRDLGIEPGPDLRRMHQLILRQDIRLHATVFRSPA